MSIGTLIFGAVIFFFEQGTYNPSTKTFLRPGSWKLNTDKNLWEKEPEESPFVSIPHSFWWALVTATTAGYGDMSPTTDTGKVTAGICMVWSLCVIALPVGVIGSNFESVWEEYDYEKRTEMELKVGESAMQRDILSSIDPVIHSGRFHIEVFHDSAMLTEENDAFIGEAEGPLKIEPRSMERIDDQLELNLSENRKKGDRNVSGKVFLSYTWLPREPKEPGVVIDGQLQVTLQRAENLAKVDWKGEYASTRCAPADPYIRLTLFPNAPSKDGLLKPRVERFKTVFDSPQPSWNQTMAFDFYWKVDGILAHKDRARHCSIHRPREFGICSTDAEDNFAFTTLPQIRKELDELRQTTPAIQAELKELRQTTRLILTTLGVSNSLSRSNTATTREGSFKDKEKAPEAVTP
eukprot:CAMPEP_0197926978 /NCGR_PEP_ID=MMETSP1439-20131203/99993_1 /TAXON_ID=66791 /ORGANISM="Gonyaulax spinifera, Strain CCMP409" /LENGTH=407 /DNA_ID=CAMNT_0043549529 /DNA_START=113 /DNA_END=1333 /DNA_ORIENTATION=-